MLDLATSPERTATTAVVRWRPVVVASILIGVIGAAISMIGSWIPSLWGDEAATMLSATRPLGTLFPMLGHVDAVHGLYYLGMHAWTALSGTSPFALRLPSALAAGACAAVVVVLCRRFVSLGWAVVGGMFAAVLPRITYAGEEARSYAFDALVATILCLIVVEIVRRSTASRRWWWAYGVTLAIGTYLFFYLSLMALVALALIVLTRPARPLVRRWAVATAWAAVACLPIIGLAVLERGQIAFLETQTPVTFTTVFVGMWFGQPPFAVLAWVLIAAAAAGTVRDVMRSRAALDAPRLDVLGLAWLILPMGLLIALSPVMAGFTNRYGTLAAPAAAVLMMLGVRRIGALVARLGLLRALAPLLVVAVVAAAAPVWASQRTPYAKNGSDWNEIAATIQAHARAGDAIVFDNDARPSRRPRLAMSTDPTAFAGVRDVTLKVPHDANDTWFDEVYTVRQASLLGRFAGVDRVWAVEYHPDATTVDTWGLADLERMGYRQSQVIREHSSTIYLYER